ncbi:MAG TPA: glycine oxidase ThiO [Terriglobales bacterium]|nr:glycine oxidase ThiO [Terriglobales bacterium]
MNKLDALDVIVIGAGIIGVSISLELRRRGLEVLVLDRGEPGGEASSAGAGMLAATEVDGPPQLREFARQSALLFPAFVRAAESDSGLSIDFNRHGAICLGDEPCQSGQRLTDAQLVALEPSLAASSLPAWFLTEDFVDPRTLMPALIESARRLGVHIHSGSEVATLMNDDAKVLGVLTSRTEFRAPRVINCCGAWSSAFSPEIPVRPVKGHMVSLIPARPHPIRHVLRYREADVYLVPRRDGHIVVGSTVEEAGFDKRVDPDIINRLHQLAADILPELGEARIHQSWAGLRPCTPDRLPILGPGPLSGYFLATGHFRNGILLAPATAMAMADLVTGAKPRIDLSPFSPARF